MKNKPSKSKPEGFSLLEVVVVLAVLSTLAGLTLPNVLRLLAFNDIDAAKALLNTAAADCIQKLRTGETAEDKNKLDTLNILSESKLNTLGYSLVNKENADFKQSCNPATIFPTDPNDTIRYEMGFRVIQEGSDQGKLVKEAKPNEGSSDQASDASCRAWAGDNCTFSTAYKDYLEYMERIDKEKSACTEAYYKEKNSEENGKKKTALLSKWNPLAEKDCPDAPPKVESPTCTYNGCNLPAYVYKGQECGSTEDEFEACIGEDNKILCNAWKAEQIKSDNNLGEAKFYEACGGDAVPWYFCGGKIYQTGSEMNKCIDDKTVAECGDYREAEYARRASSRESGLFDLSKFSNTKSNSQCSTKEYWCCKDGTTCQTGIQTEVEFNSVCTTASPGRGSDSGSGSGSSSGNTNDGGSTGNGNSNQQQQQIDDAAARIRGSSGGGNSSNTGTSRCVGRRCR